MRSSPVKRSIVINGQRTSISLEEAFWNTLKDIAHERRVTLSQLVANLVSMTIGNPISHHPFGCLFLSFTKNELPSLSSGKYLYSMSSVGSGADLDEKWEMLPQADA